MIDYGYLRGNGADARDMCRKKVVVSGGIGPDNSEGGGGNRRGGGGENRQREKQRDFQGNNTCNNVAYKLSLRDRL